MVWCHWANCKDVKKQIFPLARASFWHVADDEFVLLTYDKVKMVFIGKFVEDVLVVFGFVAVIAYLFKSFVLYFFLVDL